MSYPGFTITNDTRVYPIDPAKSRRGFTWGAAWRVRLTHDETGEYVERLGSICTMREEDARASLARDVADATVRPWAVIVWQTANGGTRMADGLREGAK